ncbi:MAG: F0F1 ATP synthase subunit alpha, partial [Ruminococcus sp.]|nr:F0F1 ATP synthase subunit alpha [Ruminococcus sp.]
NVISITDGQIFLESELFFSGMRPAVNVGLSVSRVGGAAQTKAMKKVAGKMRIELAQFREMEVFTQFSSELDPATQAMLDHGHVLMELLKQPLYHPLPLWQQVVILSAASERLLDDLQVNEINSFRHGLISEISDNHPEIVTEIMENKIVTDELMEKIKSVIVAYKKQVR